MFFHNKNTQNKIKLKKIIKKIGLDSLELDPGNDYNSKKRMLIKIPKWTKIGKEFITRNSTDGIHIDVKSKNMSVSLKYVSESTFKVPYEDIDGSLIQQLYSEDDEIRITATVMFINKHVLNGFF